MSLSLSWSQAVGIVARAPKLWEDGVWRLSWEPGQPLRPRWRLTAEQGQGVVCVFWGWGSDCCKCPGRLWWDCGNICPGPEWPGGGCGH